MKVKSNFIHADGMSINLWDLFLFLAEERTIL